MRRLVAALALLLAACRAGDRPAARDSGAAIDPAVVRSPGATQAFEGKGWALSVPVGTRRKVSEDCPGGRLVGPPADTIGGRARPRFDLCVETFANPGRRPLDRWVDSVRVERDRMRASGSAALDTVRRVMVGNVPMFRLEPPCGDCDAYEYYAAGADRVVAFSFATGIHLAGTRAEQEGAHLAVLRTFRWTSTAAPGPAKPSGAPGA